eukprot:gene4665-6553_t
MAPKKMVQKQTKKKAAMRNSSEEEDLHLSQIDVQYNPDIISNLLGELSNQVDAKCNQIQRDSDFMITSIQQAFHLELIKLPNQVKTMSMKRFKEEFGDSLEAVTRVAINGNTIKNNDFHKNTSRLLQTPSQKFGNNSNQISLQTPAASTQVRFPKEGEVILSANGSPLGQFNTVKKIPKGDLNGKNIIPPTPGLYVPLSSGEVIDMDSADIENLSEQDRQDALLKMQEVMNNMQAIMSKLTQPVSY